MMIPALLIVFIIFAIAMIVLKSMERKKPGKTPNPFDLVQIGNTRGVQLLESFYIIDSTINIDTLQNRFKFILDKYSTMVVLSTFKHQYVEECEKAVNTYKGRYPEREIKPLHMSLLITPDIDAMKSYLADVTVLCFSRYVKQQIEQINKLKMASAKNKRAEKVDNAANSFVHVITEFNLPTADHHAKAIEQLKQLVVS